MEGRQAMEGPSRGLLSWPAKVMRPKNSEHKLLGTGDKYPQHRKKWEQIVTVGLDSCSVLALDLSFLKLHVFDFPLFTDRNSETRS